MHTIIRFAFDQFYTTFARTYDAVAHLVSFGEWEAWGRTAIRFLPHDGRLLEIAHGPGHLHLALHQQGLDVVGVDLSMQMCRMLRHRITHASPRSLGPVPRQARASALRLPFADASFAGVVSTFPAGFIFARDTLHEVKRVLQPGGRFVIVPGARLRGRDTAARLLRLAYQITGQSETPDDRVRPLFESTGFVFEAHTVRTVRAEVAVWLCVR